MGTQQGPVLAGGALGGAAAAWGTGAGAHLPEPPCLTLVGQQSLVYGGAEMPGMPPAPGTAACLLCPAPDCWASCCVCVLHVWTSAHSSGHPRAQRPWGLSVSGPLKDPPAPGGQRSGLWCSKPLPQGPRPGLPPVAFDLCT